MKRAPHSIAFFSVSAIALAAVGCSFEANDAKLTANACQLDADCSMGSHCQANLCVSDESAALALTLAITPTHMAGGADPMPIVIGPFTLDSSSHRELQLPLPVTINGRLRDGNNQIAAELHFVPTQAQTTQIAKAIVVTTTDDSDPAADDFSVQLVSNMSYRVVVEPNDTSLPPYAIDDFTATRNGQLDIDYATHDWQSRSFVVKGAPADRSLLIRAIDSTTGETLSSSASIKDDSITLVFGDTDAPFQFEIKTEKSYSMPSIDDGSGCDNTTPVFPVLTIDEAALAQDKSGNDVLTLPKIPSPIQYAGTVQLCKGQSTKGLLGMPMALDATTLSLGPSNGTEGMIVAHYNATTKASLDANSQQLHFCTQVLPGDYVVVVTPPPSIDCEIFAERHLITADTNIAANTVLTLRTPAVLMGTITAADNTRVNNASIDVNALGRDFTLAPDDPSVPSYNRSKQSTSDENGTFMLPVDVGAYDVIIKPAAQSGFAWKVLYDVKIGARPNTFVDRIDLQDPALFEATLSFAGGGKNAQSSLAGAEVHAYTTVTETDPGTTTRSIEVATTTADENGNIMLLVAPTLKKGW